MFRAQNMAIALPLNAELAGTQRPSEVVDESAPASAPAEPIVPATFFVATQDILFEKDGAEVCDACGLTIERDGEDPDLPVMGAGAFVRSRGDRIEVEQVPLCAACAAAIGLTALARWEIEEEEG